MSEFGKKRVVVVILEGKTCQAMSPTSTSPNPGRVQPFHQYNPLWIRFVLSDRVGVRIKKAHCLVNHFAGQRMTRKVLVLELLVGPRTVQ